MGSLMLSFGWRYSAGRPHNGYRYTLYEDVIRPVGPLTSPLSGRSQRTCTLTLTLLTLLLKSTKYHCE